jgi:hypothetical protein
MWILNEYVRLKELKQSKLQFQKAIMKSSKYLILVRKKNTEGVNGNYNEYTRK